MGKRSRLTKQRINGDASLKPRTKQYHEQRLIALSKSWPELASAELRKITKTDCLNWAAKFGQNASPTVFNHTISILRQVIEIAVETGVRYDNPARFINRVSERSKKLQLPEIHQFDKFVTAIENSGSRFSKPCAQLVRFLAYGGFRKTEASLITWADCDFTRGKIIVRSDPATGTKNGEHREVPMIPETSSLLKKVKAERVHKSPCSSVMLVRECQKSMDRQRLRRPAPCVRNRDSNGASGPTSRRCVRPPSGGAAR